MNKMSLVMPSYKIKKYVIENKDEWKKLAKIVDLIWVEDTSEPELAVTVAEIGGEHYCKENGNWGSVINYIRSNKLVKTEYMAIVDPDDIVDFLELKKLILRITKHDLYLTNYCVVDYSTKSSYKKSYKFDKFTFIHQVWFKTSLFYGMENIPEKHSYMDNIVVDFLLNNSETYKNINLTPYHYFTNLPGQSTSGGINAINKKLQSASILSSSSNSTKPRNKALKWRAKVSSNSIKYQNLILIRDSYDNEATKVGRKKLLVLFKNKRPIFLPVRYWILWSKLFVLLFKRGSNE